MLSFLSVLGFLFLIIILANILGRPSGQTSIASPAGKIVSVYSIGSAPKLSLPAKIEKAGVIKIMSQTSGVVRAVNFTEGAQINKGSPIVDLSTNYQGDDMSALNYSIAQAQYKNTQDTFEMQKNLINLQKEVATQSAQNTEDLRQIADLSAHDTTVLINNNQQILDVVNQNLNNLIASSSGGLNDQMVFATKQLANQLEAGQNQLVSALRQEQYQANTSNPPSILNNLQKDITLGQLSLQQKALDLGKEISGLQLNLARVSESLMHPASPVNGTIERVFVHAGESVTPGSPIAVISASEADPDVTAIVSVPVQLAKSISQIEQSTLHIGSQEYKVNPRYISQEATEGNLYSVLYSIPQQYHSSLPNAGYITVDIPVGLPNTGKTIPFVPIDSVYQSQDAAYIYVADKGRVRTKKINLGNVFGRFVQVNSGLSDGDQVILDRTVVDGDKVSIK